MKPNAQFRAIAAEAIACAMVTMTDPEMRIIGTDPAEIRRRALLKIQMDPEIKMALTLAVNPIEQACEAYADAKINQLLQPGMQTMSMDGRLIEVDMELNGRLHVTDVLIGAGLNVSDGAFVIFIDSRCASGEALRRWQKLVKDDTRLMVIPLDVPRGQTIAQVVAAKRQDENTFTA